MSLTVISRSPRKARPWRFAFTTSMWNDVSPSEVSVPLRMNETFGRQVSPVGLGLPVRQRDRGGDERGHERQNDDTELHVSGFLPLWTGALNLGAASGKGATQGDLDEGNGPGDLLSAAWICVNVL